MGISPTLCLSSIIFTLSCHCHHFTHFLQQSQFSSIHFSLCILFISSLLHTNFPSFSHHLNCYHSSWEIRASFRPQGGPFMGPVEAPTLPFLSPRKINKYLQYNYSCTRCITQREQSCLAKHTAVILQSSCFRVPASFQNCLHNEDLYILEILKIMLFEFTQHFPSINVYLVLFGDGATQTQDGAISIR